jgi:hypothetical protein
LRYVNQRLTQADVPRLASLSHINEYRRAAGDKGGDTYGVVPMLEPVLDSSICIV